MMSIKTNNIEKTIRVLVTGVGAIIGQGIVKSLRQLSRPIIIIGLDLNMTPLALSLCDKGIEKIKVDEASDAYLEFWKILIEQEKIDLVIPGLEVDLYFLDSHREIINTTIVLNNSALICLARDKWLMSRVLQREGLAWIPACKGESWQQCQAELGSPPYVLKPRVGNGSRGIAHIDDEADFQYWTRKTTVPILIQKYIGHDEAEYTAAAFGLGNGLSLPAIVFRRRLSVAGNTQYAEVVSEPTISSVIERLCEIFTPLGPTNFQFRIQNNQVYLLEINPRISSSTSLRSAFGYNEAAMSVGYYFDGEIPQVPVINSGRAWRYVEDFIK